ncbi:hypothetical protein BSIN_2374 [Burkholderia singularis]|uniref:Uncharacterized protein n=1 Tax=Burkholderia singularis TaxID=1503053 RepID=A0A238H1N9_9BURK|nr:hypothetical protein BSIN_2374 [Burkholderia singularis]
MARLQRATTLIGWRAACYYFALNAIEGKSAGSLSAALFL